VVEGDFDLDWHMRRVRLPRGAGWPAVLEAARVAAMADFDRDRPLWEVTEFDGLHDGHVALMTKMHHCLSDGVGAMQLLAYLVDGGRKMPAPDELPPVPPGEALGAAGLVASSLRDNAREVLDVALRSGGAARGLPSLLLDPLHTADRVASMTTSVARIIRPILRPASPVMARRTMRRQLAAFDVPLEDLRSAAAANGGHINDAFLAGMTGGLRRYHEARGSIVQDLRITMPVSIRKPTDPIGGNRITLLRFGLPVGMADPAERIARIAPITRAWQHEPAIAHTQAIAFGLNLAPRSYIQGILRRVEFVGSDVPGLPEPVYGAGARVLAYYPFGPTIGAAMNASLMSYAGTCNIGLNIDVGAVPDPDELVTHLRAGFEEVLALVPSTAAHVAEAG
jgi:diacylglycerol O-acyltransferase